MVMELVNVPDCPKAAATSTKKKNHRKPKMKPQAGAAVSPANGIGYVKDKEDACAKELTQDDHNTGITPAALQQPAMPQQQQQQQDTPMDEDPFASLVGSLKRLSLVPRSVTTRSGTNAPTKPTPHAPPASATSLPIVLLAAPACPGPATGAVVTAKTPPHATHGPAIQSPVKSLGAAAAGGGNGMWARERVLAAYRAAVPDRAHEAERMWKERRAVRKAAWNAEVLAAAGGRVDVEEGDGEGMDVEDVGESD
ncbi:hypothetical protein BC830DRAFT_620890 [Chytriomyces sp. MP71]|nr:hypothetical protein BC830DRAFT_620890 [Chytriomyces sp. MP71]